MPENEFSGMLPMASRRATIAVTSPEMLYEYSHEGQTGSQPEAKEEPLEFRWNTFPSDSRLASWPLADAHGPVSGASYSTPTQSCPCSRRSSDSASSPSMQVRSHTSVHSTATTSSATSSSSSFVRSLRRGFPDTRMFSYYPTFYKPKRSKSVGDTLATVREASATNAGFKKHYTPKIRRPSYSGHKSSQDANSKESPKTPKPEKRPGQVDGRRLQAARKSKSESGARQVELKEETASLGMAEPPMDGWQETLANQSMKHGTSTRKSLKLDLTQLGAPKSTKRRPVSDRILSESRPMVHVAPLTLEVGPVAQRPGSRHGEDRCHPVDLTEKRWLSSPLQYLSKDLASRFRKSPKKTSGDAVSQMAPTSSCHLSPLLMRSRPKKGFFSRRGSYRHVRDSSFGSDSHSVKNSTTPGTSRSLARGFGQRRTTTPPATAVRFERPGRDIFAPGASKVQRTLSEPPVREPAMSPMLTTSDNGQTTRSFAGTRQPNPPRAPTGYFTYDRGGAEDTAFRAPKIHRVVTPTAVHQNLLTKPKVTSYYFDYRLPKPGLETEDMNNYWDSDAMLMSQSPLTPYLPDTASIVPERPSGDKEWFRVRVDEHSDDESLVADEASWDVPEHLPRSPLCPLSPKHSSGGNGSCPYHSR